MARTWIVMFVLSILYVVYCEESQCPEKWTYIENPRGCEISINDIGGPEKCLLEGGDEITEVTMFASANIQEDGGRSKCVKEFAPVDRMDVGFKEEENEEP